MKRLLWSLVALGVLVGGVGQARAGYLGATMDWQYFAFGGPYTGPNVFVDCGGVAGVFTDKAGVPYFKIIADDNSITFDYSLVTRGGMWAGSSRSLRPTIRNGIAIDLISGPDFGSVTVDPATNMIGFDKGHVSFTSHQIQVDWQELPFGPDTIVKVDIAPVPEPSTVLLLVYSCPRCGRVALRPWAHSDLCFSGFPYSTREPVGKARSTEPMARNQEFQQPQVPKGFPAFRVSAFQANWALTK